MNDWDPTDRVVVIIHETGPATEELDDGPTPTTPPPSFDVTERHKCEFDEDTAVELNYWAHAPN